MTRFRPRVGRQVVRKSVSEPTKADTFAARESMKRIISNYEDFIKHVEKTTPEILVEALRPTFKTAKKYTPKDTGVLVNSGYLEIISFRGKPTVEIGFGKGGKPDYAATVHENLEFKHKAPTRAKFLQYALNEHQGQVEKDIVKQLKAIVE